MDNERIEDVSFYVTDMRMIGEIFVNCLGFKGEISDRHTSRFTMPNGTVIRTFGPKAVAGQGPTYLRLIVNDEKITKVKELLEAKGEKSIVYRVYEEGPRKRTLLWMMEENGSQLNLNSER